MKTCKLQSNGYCNHLGLYAPAELCEVCTRYPGGPNDGKDPKPEPAKPLPAWAVELDKRQAMDKAKFALICEKCEMRATDACYYVKRPCTVGKAGSECPQGRWKAITVEEVQELKNNNNEVQK